MAGKHRRPHAPARGRHRKPGQLASLSADKAAPAAMTAALALPAAAGFAAPAGAAAASAGPVATAQLTAYRIPAYPVAARQPARVTSYRIRPGDTLGAISARFCGTSADYPGLAAGNGIADPDLIMAGRHAADHLPGRACRGPRESRGEGLGRHLRLPEPLRRRRRRRLGRGLQLPGDRNGDRPARIPQHAPPLLLRGSSQRYSGSSSFEQCVISSANAEASPGDERSGSLRILSIQSLVAA